MRYIHPFVEPPSKALFAIQEPGGTGPLFTEKNKLTNITNTALNSAVHIPSRGITYTDHSNRNSKLSEYLAALLSLHVNAVACSQTNQALRLSPEEINSTLKNNFFNFSFNFLLVLISVRKIL